MLFDYLYFHFKQITKKHEEKKSVRRTQCRQSAIRLKRIKIVISFRSRGTAGCRVVSLSNPMHLVRSALDTGAVVRATRAKLGIFATWKCQNVMQTERIKWARSSDDDTNQPIYMDVLSLCCKAKCNSIFFPFIPFNRLSFRIVERKKVDESSPIRGGISIRELDAQTRHRLLPAVESIQ